MPTDLMPFGECLCGAEADNDLTPISKFMNNQMNDQINREERSKKIDLLERYSLWLETQGYMDVDWRTEPPYAIDEFLKIL